MMSIAHLFSRIKNICAREKKNKDRIPLRFFFLGWLCTFLIRIRKTAMIDYDQEEGIQDFSSRLANFFFLLLFLPIWFPGDTRAILLESHFEFLAFPTSSFPADTKKIKNIPNSNLLPFSSFPDFLFFSGREKCNSRFCALEEEEMHLSFSATKRKKKEKRNRIGFFASL